MNILVFDKTASESVYNSIRMVRGTKFTHSMVVPVNSRTGITQDDVVFDILKASYLGFFGNAVDMKEPENMDSNIVVNSYQKNNVGSSIKDFISSGKLNELVNTRTHAPILNVDESYLAPYSRGDFKDGGHFFMNKIVESRLGSYHVDLFQIMKISHLHAKARRINVGTVFSKIYSPVFYLNVFEMWYQGANMFEDYDVVKRKEGVVKAISTQGFQNLGLKLRELYKE